MIELRYFEESHFQQLIEWVKTPEMLLQWAGPQFSFPLDEVQLNDYLRGANQSESSKLIYSVFYKETGGLIGHISLGNIDRKNLSARIGKVLVGDPNVRGKGIGEATMKEILNIAFGQLHLHRVGLGVFDFNVSAIKCYEKVGFVKEGLLRDHRKLGDEYWSQWEMSILEDEWPALDGSS